MVRDFEGDPSRIFYGPGDSRNTCDPTDPDDSADCNRAEDVEQGVFCTCRCDAPAGSNTPTCECPSGFVCQEVLQSGGVGIQGGYCVREVRTVTPGTDGG
jgi:hypothetical protein